MYKGYAKGNFLKKVSLGTLQKLLNKMIILGTKWVEHSISAFMLYFKIFAGVVGALFAKSSPKRTLTFYNLH